MKKIIISCLIVIILVIIGISLYLTTTKDNKNDNLTKVTVAEVAHSVFYAPQYLADSLGYFESFGLDVDITLTAGADAVMSAVLSNDVNIGFCGTEATIYLAAKIEKELFYNK